MQLKQFRKLIRFAVDKLPEKEREERISRWSEMYINELDNKGQQSGDTDTPLTK